MKRTGNILFGTFSILSCLFIAINISAMENHELNLSQAVTIRYNPEKEQDRFKKEQQRLEKEKEEEKASKKQKIEESQAFFELLSNEVLCHIASYLKNDCPWKETEEQFYDYLEFLKNKASNSKEERYYLFKKNDQSVRKIYTNENEELISSINDINNILLSKPTIEKTNSQYKLNKICNFGISRNGRFVAAIQGQFKPWIAKDEPSIHGGWLANQTGIHFFDLEKNTKLFIPFPPALLTEKVTKMYPSEYNCYINLLHGSNNTFIKNNQNEYEKTLIFDSIAVNNQGTTVFLATVNSIYLWMPSAGIVKKRLTLQKNELEKPIKDLEKTTSNSIYGCDYYGKIKALAFNKQQDCIGFATQDNHSDIITLYRSILTLQEFFQKKGVCKNLIPFYERQNAQNQNNTTKNS